MLKRYLWILFLGLSLSGCSSIPNVPICAEVNISKGLCTFTVSGKTIVIDDENTYEGQTWFDLRVKALTVPASSWAKIKAFLVKQCKKTNQCDVDIDSWDRNLDSNSL